MLFLPYSDDNPPRSFPLVNWFLIALNFWVFFFWQLGLDQSQSKDYFNDFGFVPQNFLDQLYRPSPEGAVRQWSSVFTSMFSHGGIGHLLGNMLFLYLYGDNMEDAMGKIRYILFYLSCGFTAALSQAFANQFSDIPMVGASGAISGVIAGYLLLYPRANTRVFYWFIIFVGTIYIPSYILLFLWLFQQALALPESLEQSSGVAVAAHLGGFAAGLILTPLFKSHGVKMFQPGNRRAFSRHPRKPR